MWHFKIWGGTEKRERGNPFQGFIESFVRRLKSVKLQKKKKKKRVVDARTVHGVGSGLCRTSVTSLTAAFCADFPLPPAAEPMQDAASTLVDFFLFIYLIFFCIFVNPASVMKFIRASHLDHLFWSCWNCCNLGSAVGLFKNLSLP